MLILLRTQVDRTDKTPVTARRARVGGLCGFRSPAERVPIQQQKTRRCADVRERWRKMLVLARRAVGKAACGKCRKTLKTVKIEGFWTPRRESGGQAGERTGAFLRQPVHFCPQCGQFWAVKTALFCEGEKWISADFRKKPRSCRCCRHYFGAFCFWRG